MEPSVAQPSGRIDRKPADLFANPCSSAVRKRQTSPRRQRVRTRYLYACARGSWPSSRSGAVAPPSSSTRPPSGRSRCTASAAPTTTRRSSRSSPSGTRRSGSPTSRRSTRISAPSRSAAERCGYCSSSPIRTRQSSARAMGWVGFNLSIPHKVAVLEHLDDLADSAEVIGAVNCVVRREGRYIGENTDGQGFLAALRTVVDSAGRSFVLFGAGGAARAIAVEAALAGAASIMVVNRDPTRGAELVALLRERTPTRAELAVWDGGHRVAEGTDTIVNATPIGLA